MAAEAEADIIRYVITGEDGEVIPPNATHVSVHPSVKVIRRQLFYAHRKIVELVCHAGVIKIEYKAFFFCPRLKRVIMNGVEEIEGYVFLCCEALEYIECDKLEIIGVYVCIRQVQIYNQYQPAICQDSEISCILELSPGGCLIWAQVGINQGECFP